MSVRLLSREDLKALGIRYSASQLARKMREGSFPSAIKGAGKSNCWAEPEIDRYIADLIAARTSRTQSPAGQAA
jgi:predicted DNA-binding transcriptional regulator AlpA